MAPEHGHRPRPAHDRVAEAAFSCGVVAMVFVFVPIIGDFIAVPAALAAMALAIVDIVRGAGGVATASGRALTGGLLGMIAAFTTLLSYTAMGTFG